MIKFTICFLALSFAAAVYVDSASLKSTTPYELSFQRLRDIVQTYQSRFPDSKFVQGLLEELSIPAYQDVPFFPYIISFVLRPINEYTFAFSQKFQELLQYLSIDPSELSTEKIKHIKDLLDPTSDEVLQLSFQFGKNLLDLVEAIDWSFLLNFNADSLNLSDAQKFIVSTTIKTGFAKLMDDLSKVSTLEQLVAFDFVKYINSFNAILAAEGIVIIDIGK